jgi:23S rRNA pseudouridine1911/1915/1917 synthase
MNLKILFEDNHIIAIDKNCGDLSQGDFTGKKSLLDIIKEYIKKKYNKPGNVFLGLVHRLDKPVSGIILFARTSKAASRLHEIFLNRKINKFYIVIVNRFY